jgi:hypothetical protein
MRSSPRLLTVWTRELVARVVLSFVFRLGCYAVTVWLALWAEARPASTLPDALLWVVPYVEWVERHNCLTGLVA